MSRTSGVKKRVLVIDDDEGVLTSARAHLEGEGFDVVTTVNGQEALILLLQNEVKIDLILLDLYMPRMNGWQFAYYLRKTGSDAHRKIPIVINSAIETQAGKDASFAFDGYLQKPLKAQEMLSACKQFLTLT